MMKVVEKILDKEPVYKFDHIKKEDVIFFDIETTGLSANTSVLYLIGVVYYDNNSWNFVQWFADDSEDEEKIIGAFFKCCENKKVLFNYNGNGFDIPYIKSKIKQLKLDYSFDNIESIDLYKICRKYKDVLQLENCKLKTLERFLGICREDKFSGKELIDTYKKFIKIYSLERINGDKDKQYKESTPLLNELLLHNEEDIVNLLEVIRIYNYKELFDGNVTYSSYKVDENRLILIYEGNINDYCVNNKQCIQIKNGNILVVIEDCKLEIRIPLLHEELKFFYPDYKEYYYLPLEDVAMHKSIATYVDREHRQQAKASNCYTKKKDVFVMAMEQIGLALFKKEYGGKDSYCLLNDIEKKNRFEDYGRSVLKSFGIK